MAAAKANRAVSVSQEQELEQIGTPAGKLDKKREATSPLDQLP